MGTKMNLPKPANDNDLITLEQAAALIPGADVNTLKRRQRQGRLTVYRPGKAFLTTPADVQEMIRQCRVVPKVQGCGFVRLVETRQETPLTSQLGSSLTEIASAALDSALAQAKMKRMEHSARI